MNFKFFTSPRFDKEAKRLSKKFPSLKADLIKLQNNISQTSNFGIPLGKNLFKLRLKVTSKARGKSGGLRVINNVEINVIEEKSSIYFLTLYDKSEASTISVKEILEIVSSIK